LEAQKLQGRPGDSVGYFKNKYKRHSPEYLIVIDLEDFDRQKELKDFLTSRFPILAVSDKYLIFDLTKEIDSVPAGDWGK
jgi:hypothetical protein